MSTSLSTRDSGALRLRAWRWHLLAAILVVPFVLWQSVTGTIYLWSQTWVDARYAALRFVQSAPDRASVDIQVRAAREELPGSRISGVVLPADPHRSTLVTFEDAGGLPLAVFVDPYRGHVLGTLRGADWPPGWSRKLHGGWPLGNAGSWLLELGACWTIVTVLTGLYLWWPRDGRKLLQVLIPRVGAGRRVFWRDLHACVAVWFSLLIVAFLITALPWTSFWGEQVLGRLQTTFHQQMPPAAGFAPVFTGSEPDTRVASLDVMVRDARASGMQGDILLYMVDGPPGSAVSVRSMRQRSVAEQYVLFDRGSGARAQAVDWSDFPPLARAVATGVDLHEGSFFGRAGPWINTVFAAALVWLAATGLAAWWLRRPARALGLPTRVAVRWPAWLVGSGAVLCVALPLLAASVLLLWLAEHVWRLLPLTGNQKP